VPDYLSSVTTTRGGFPVVEDMGDAGTAGEGTSAAGVGVGCGMISGSFSFTSPAPVSTSIGVTLDAPIGSVLDSAGAVGGSLRTAAAVVAVVVTLVDSVLPKLPFSSEPDFPSPEIGFTSDFATVAAGIETLPETVAFGLVLISGEVARGGGLTPSIGISFGAPDSSASFIRFTFLL